MPCSAWKCVPAIISGGVDISQVSGCHLLQMMSSQWGSQKLLQRLVVNHSLPFWPIFNWMKWLFYQKDINQISLNHTTRKNIALRILATRFGIWTWIWSASHCSEKVTASVYFQGNSLISFNNFLLVMVRQLLFLIQEIEVIQGVQALLKRTLEQTTEQIR